MKRNEAKNVFESFAKLSERVQTIFASLRFAYNWNDKEAKKWHPNSMLQSMCRFLQTVFLFKKRNWYTKNVFNAFHAQV